MSGEHPTTEPPVSGQPSSAEADSRFPSGKWIGFYLQKWNPGRHQMELILQFAEGALTGEGRDDVGPFLITGRYEVEGGTCYWHKRYLGKHDVFYQGYNESKGVWGTWEIGAPLYHDRGGFRIWPEGMADPTVERLHESKDAPISFETDERAFSEERLNDSESATEPARSAE